MSEQAKPASRLERTLGAVERIGNRLPDPAMLFVGLLVLVWVLSALLSGLDFGLTDPRNGEPLRVSNQLSGSAMAAFLSAMVKNFAHFHPVGVVLVAMLGIGVADEWHGYGLGSALVLLL